MEIGLIEWFNEEKGFGVIKTLKNDEVFLHITNWVDKNDEYPSLRSPVVFEIGHQKGKITALNCSKFDSNQKNHWDSLLLIESNSFTVRIKYSEFNILKVVINQCRIDFDFSTIHKQINKLIFNLSDEDIFNRNLLFYDLYRSSSNASLKLELQNALKLRINKLENSDILKFWKNNVFEGYKPDNSFISDHFNELGPKEIENISSEETRHLIIVRKLNELNKDFQVEEFKLFDEYIDLLKSEKLGIKVITDLNSISKKFYIPKCEESLLELVREDEVSFYQLSRFENSHPKFISDEVKEILLESQSEKIQNYCPFKIITECWIKGLLKNLDENVLSTLSEQTTEDLIYFLSWKELSELQIVNVLNLLLDREEYETVLVESKKKEQKIFERFDEMVFNAISIDKYFEFWVDRIGQITPIEYLIDYLDHTEEKYLDLKTWNKKGILNQDDLISILHKNIESIKIVEDRYEFYRLYYSLKTLLYMDADVTILKSHSCYSIISIILWHLGKIEDFTLEDLKGKFIYFQPQDQVFIFKRLFYLKHKGQIDFDLNEIDELVRADIELYLLNEKFENDFVLDISTHVILECIKSYARHKHFNFESDLILKDLNRNSQKKFKIEQYFDHCLGRMTPSWDWNTEGKITLVYFNEQQFYYAIEFPPGVEATGRNYYGSYTYFEKNPNFEHLKEEVKKLPGRKWNPEKNHWGVPSKYKDDVYEFAKRNKFFIELSNRKHYENNVHLVEFTRYSQEERNSNDLNIPRGITFCEGRLAKKEHRLFQKEFWWCCNQECMQNSSEDHLTTEFENSINESELEKRQRFYGNDHDPKKKPWEHYTLLDILHVLNINVDENNGIDNIKDGNYYKLLGHINAFNRLLERLYCEECNNLLYPKNTSHFALYRDIRFYCIENDCSKKGEEIYLNHCLYGECKTIIDSRISKRCEHGLYICHYCGTCCSEEMFKRRLSNLETVGGYIHPELIENVNQRNGHLDKKEYYCYKCSNMMNEIDENTYRCSTCNVHYDLSIFKWLNRKWTQKNRRRKDYPVGNPSSRGRTNDEDDFPF